MIRDRREDIEDAPAHRELATAGHHVDAVVREFDEPLRDVREIVPALADSEMHLDRIGQACRQRLQRAANGCRDHERALTRPARDAPEHVEAVADGLGARAETLVRKRLPRREVHDLGSGEERLERGAERFGAAPGGCDDEQRSAATGGAAPLDQRGEERGVEPLDEREVGVDGCRGRGIPERVRLFEGAHDPGNCHRTSLRAPGDTRSPERTRGAARTSGLADS